LRPEVAFLGASLEARVGELDAAEHALRSCYERAVAVGNDRLAARVSLMLLRTVMFSSRPARVHDLAPFARADAARAHVPDAEIDSIVGEATLSEGDVDAAIAQLQRALEQETRPRRRALTMMTMASALLQRGETERAVEAYEGALQIVRDALGDDHPAVAFHMVRLGRGLRAAGRLDAASGVLDEAVERTRSLHGPDDRATASALLELGRLRAAQGRVEEARARLSEALAIRSAAYGPDHPRVADIETDLGDLERDGGSVAAARRHYQRALAIRQRATPDHPAVASLRQSIAALEESGGAAEEGLGVGEQGEVPTRGADVRP
jgi:tetratricopeptide (TPR) repeat protein